MTLMVCANFRSSLEPGCDSVYLRASIAENYKKSAYIMLKNAINPQHGCGFCKVIVYCFHGICSETRSYEGTKIFLSLRTAPDWQNLSFEEDISGGEILRSIALRHFPQALSETFHPAGRA